MSVSNSFNHVMAIEKANGMGIVTKKKWTCRFVNSRETHMHAHGEIRADGEKFSNGLLYPGDPSGGAAEVINCHCVLVPVVAMPQKARKQLNYNSNDVIIQTGGKYEVGSEEWFVQNAKKEKKAKEFYESVRKTNDISLVAKYGGLSIEEATKVKNHVFFNKHILYDSVDRFQADYDMAVAWKRITNGIPTYYDKILLRHELLELTIENELQCDISTAHEKANKEYPWSEILNQIYGEDGEPDDLL